MNLENGHSIFAKIKSSNYAKIQFDFGTHELHGKKINCYSQFLTDRSFGNTSFRLGFKAIGSNWSFDNRLKVNLGGEKKDFILYNRLLRSLDDKEKFRFGAYWAYNLGTHILQKTGLLFRYSHGNGQDFYIRAENKDWRTNKINWKARNGVFDSVILDYVGKINDDVKVGLEAQISTDSLKISKFEAAVEAKLPKDKSVVKARINPL